MNYHNFIIYEPTEDHDLFMKVVGLDSGQFTLRAIEEVTEYIKIEDSKPFTYLLDKS